MENLKREMRVRESRRNFGESKGQLMANQMLFFLKSANQMLKRDGQRIWKELRLIIIEGIYWKEKMKDENVNGERK